jgi:opacity protein-like surface antigen
LQLVLLLIGLATLRSVAAYAQTDVAASLYGAFTGNTGNKLMSPEGVVGNLQSPSNAAGGLLEVRHIARPWFGYEGTYSINRANKSYFSSSGTVTCGVCESATTWTPVSANAHEVTGDWVASLKVRNLRPFALAGAGILFDVPTSGQVTATGIITGCGGGNPACTVNSPFTATASTTSATKPVFVYGAGMDWGLLPHLGLRLQYRGNLYKAPDLLSGFTSTNALIHTAEPMIGVYFRL